MAVALIIHSLEVYEFDEQGCDPPLLMITSRISSLARVTLLFLVNQDHTQKERSKCQTTE
jgi:hypothetical protein